MDTNAKTETAQTTSPAADAAAAEQVARCAYGFWVNQPVESRDVAAALAQVADRATDPAVRHWAAGTHPTVVLETLERDFREWVEAERRALGR